MIPTLGCIPLQSVVKEEAPDAVLSSSVAPLFVARLTSCLFCIESKELRRHRIGSLCHPANRMDQIEQAHLEGQDPEARI